MWKNTEGENKMMKESRDHNFPPMHIRQASSFFKKNEKRSNNNKKIMVNFNVLSYSIKKII